MVRRFLYTHHVNLAPAIVPTRFWEYLVTTILIIWAPGPSVLFAIARAISWGKRVAVATVFGNALGMYLVSFIVAFGLGPILERSQTAFLAVQILGGMYLIYLGISAIRHSVIHAENMINTDSGKPTTLRALKDGFWVGALNPKTLVFFAAIIPQFLDKGSHHLTQQIIFLSTIFAFIAFLSDSMWAFIAGTIRERLSQSPQKLVAMRRGGGLVMIGLGLFTISTAF